MVISLESKLHQSLDAGVSLFTQRVKMLGFVEP